MPAIVNSSTVAHELNLTERRIEQLVHEGMPKLERGRYDLYACAKWYIRYLQNAMERRATETGDDSSKSLNLNEEKKRLIRAQADIAEVELKKKIGELIPANLVDDKFMTFAGVVHDRFLSLPPRIAPRLEGESRDVIRIKLHEVVRDTLNGLSNDLPKKLAATKHDDTKASEAGSDSKKRKPRRATYSGSVPRGKKTRRRS
jgi:phage terminase Nu1 subunit (DNA packaging protein)